MKTAPERIDDLLDYSKLSSLQKLAEELGIPKQNLYDVKREKCGISRKLADAIQSKYPEISNSWLRNGVGNMTNSPIEIHNNIDNNSSAEVNIGSKNNYVPTSAPKSEVKANTIPLIPMDAHAGSLADYADSAMEYHCERFVSPIAGASCAIRIAGESMAPEYPNGSIAILKKVNEKAFIEWGKVYVLDTENGAIIKEIRKTEEKGVVECVSLNPDPKYQPFEVETDYINGWYRVLMVMSMK